MTEIKRLSDADIEWFNLSNLRGKESGACYRCPIGRQCFDEQGISILHCNTMVNEAIRLEMEAREEAGVK